MQTYGNMDIQEMPLRSPFFHDKVERFLAANGLRLEEVDMYLAVQNADGEILAGGGLFKDIIKCIAVAPEARSEGLAAPLVSRLIAEASARGIHNLKVFTKPENQAIFESLGFRLLAAAPKAILMENGRGLEQYCAYLREHRRPGRNGVIVMNANPFTLGHKYLIDKASEQVDTLYVIPVKEDVSQFPYAERLAMIKAAVIPGLTGDLQSSASAEARGIGKNIFRDGTRKTIFPEAIANPSHADGNIAPAGPTASENYFSGRYPKSQFPEAIANPSHAGASLVMPGADRTSHIIVLDGSDYCISAATFPTYFLKDLSDAADTQMRLDLDLYSRWIAPALDASVRFVGSEPFDALTAHYNTLIPNAVEIPRLESASAGAHGIGEIIFPGDTGKTNFPEAIANPTHGDADIASAGPTASENYFSGRYPKSQFPEAIANPTHADASDVSAGAHGIVKNIFPGGTGKTNFPEAISNPTHADAISASAVRAALAEGSFGRAAELCPVTTHPYLLAELAGRALRMELELPMKPGLVCPDSNGAHKDMDYALMLKGIGAIRPFFPQMVVASSADELRLLGIDAEKAMLEATGGVNTHRGAIFALGLALNAAGALIGREMETAQYEEDMQKLLCQITQELLHNSQSVSQFHSTLVGARRMAAEGYRELFEDWLPYYRSGAGELKTLLRIMSTLDDTCVVKRVGAQRAEEVKREAEAVLQEIPGPAGDDGSPARLDGVSDGHGAQPSWPAPTGHLRELCERFAKEGISPGGAADMLALTLFIDSVTN